MSMEAMLCFIVFLVLLGAFAAVENAQLAKGIEARGMFRAKMQSEGCAAVIDALYANSGGTVRGFNANCYMDGQGRVASKSGGFEKASIILNGKTKLAETGSGTVIEVGVNEHYGQRH